MSFPQCAADSSWLTAPCDEALPGFVRAVRRPAPDRAARVLFCGVLSVKLIRGLAVLSGIAAAHFLVTCLGRWKEETTPSVICSRSVPGWASLGFYLCVEPAGPT